MTDADANERAYDAQRERAAKRMRRLAESGRNIGEIPPVMNRARRDGGERNLRLFLETYFAPVFRLKWSADHLRVIERIETCVLDGGQFAMAMPRGTGKTNLCEKAAIWAVVYGHRRFPVLVGATEDDAKKMLDTIGTELEVNDLLLEDFPEVCFPIRALEGIANRCAGQLYNGERTRVTWTDGELVLPTIKGSKASGAIVRVAGLTGRIRGMKGRAPDGSSIRPDLVIIDDPQTDESAKSLTQSMARERIVAGAVLGLAGPDKKIAAVMPCTVIRPGDMADNILDRTKNPDWNGERTKLVYAFPTSKLWERYAEIRSESLRRFGDIREATEFYRANRDEMDRGAVVAWPERFYPNELSAIQHAMNLRLKNEASFFAEYQNEPLRETGADDSGLLGADEIAEKLNGIKRGIVPLGVTHLTAFVDIQQRALFWAVCGWHDDFTGYIVDYGGHPDQNRDYWTLGDASPTLADVAQSTGFEGAIYAGLEGLAARILAREWQREDGGTLRIEKCVVDANWGIATDVVYQFCRQSAHAAVLLPSHGRYFGPSAKPFQEWAKKPGDQIGWNWRIPGTRGKRAVRHVIYDTNVWKTFLHSRLAVAMGDPGCLSLCGRERVKHRMLAEHLTAECRERMEGHSRIVDVWKLRPGVRDNHLFDCVVGSAVAASILGSALPTQNLKPVARAKRVRMSDRRGRVWG